MVSFSGDKYLYSGCDMPDFYSWVMKAIGIDISKPKPCQEDMEIDPPQNFNH